MQLSLASWVAKWVAKSVADGGSRHCSGLTFYHPGCISSMFQFINAFGSRIYWVLSTTCDMVRAYYHPYPLGRKKTLRL